MLKPITMPGDAVPEIEQGSDSPIISCEACSKAAPMHKMINVMITIGSPGHPALAPFQCSAIEHWACSPDCWKAVAHACIDEHMHALLRAHRDTVGL